MTIDWTKPIETTDGKPCRVLGIRPNSVHIAIDAAHQFSGGGKLWPSGEEWHFGKDGTDPCSIITLRNAPEPAAQPLYDRLVKLAERIAASKLDGTLSEAQAIMAELKPVDPDLIEARRIGAEAEGENKGYQYLDGSRGEYPTMKVILAALKRGRELAEKGNG